MLFQPLIQLVYGFLAQILAGKEIETKFIIIRKTSDIFFFKQIPTEIGWKMLSNNLPTSPNLVSNLFIDF